MEDGRKAVLLNRAGNILYALSTVLFSILFCILVLGSATFQNVISIAFLAVLIANMLFFTTMFLLTVYFSAFSIIILFIYFVGVIVAIFQNNIINTLGIIYLGLFIAAVVLKRISNSIALSVIKRFNGKELIVLRTNGGRTGRVIIEGAEFKVESQNSFLKVGDRVELNEIHEVTEKIPGGESKSYHWEYYVDYVDPDHPYRRYELVESTDYREPTEHTYHIQEGASKPFDKRALHNTYLVHLSEEYEAQKKAKEAEIERTLTVEEKKRLEEYREKLYNAFRIEKIGRAMRSSRTFTLAFLVFIFSELLTALFYYPTSTLVVIAKSFSFLLVEWYILSLLMSAYGRMRTREFDKKIEKILRRY